jgi:predicted ester cyclase
MSNITNNISLARRVIAAVDANDEAALDDLIHPAFRGHGGQDETSGLDGMRATMRWLHSTFSGMTSTPEDLIASDDRVVARVRFRGTPKVSIDGVRARRSQRRRGTHPHLARRRGNARRALARA